MSLSQVLALNLFKRSSFPGTPYQEAYFYDANDLLEYAAFAPRGAATSYPGWFIVKFTYSASNQVATVKTAPLNAILDDRTGLTYA